MKKNGFPKQERISSRDVIRDLFAKGRVLKAYPFRILFMEADKHAEVPLQVLISVPKRRFPRAVDRNAVKRQIREAWRTENHGLKEALAEEGKNIAVTVVFVGKERLSSQIIRDKIILSLQRLEQEIRSS